MSNKLFLLGAGKPASGKSPSALKNITNTTKAIDWQLRSFSGFVEESDVHFLGGYDIDKVINYYPKINFTLATDWKESSPLDTLLKAPFSESRTILTYSDTIFRNHSIKSVAESNADIAICVDSLWRNRYKSRDSIDLMRAEIINYLGNEAEFTGLVCFSKKVVSKIKKELDKNLRNINGNNLVSFIEHLISLNFTTEFIDVKGEWAEFNSPDDISNFILGTKADTLSRLMPLVKKSKIGVQNSFTKGQWDTHKDSLLESLLTFFGETQLIVRSSSSAEDNWHSSNAGGFESILDVSSNDKTALSSSIDKVFKSYGKKCSKHDQILIQEFVDKVNMAGVVFTCSLESGSPYYKFNFDDKSNSTESVTSGKKADLRTVIVSKVKSDKISDIAPELEQVLDAIKELEDILGFDKLDIEFAVDSNNTVHIFQVRPVAVDHNSYDLNIEDIESSLNDDVSRFISLQKKLPFISGDKTIFSNMPDWNPAEIIGTKPKPLSFSLYQKLITNDIWAKQRAEFGYRDVRPCPLIYSFSSQPYVDVRASFNSFIPASIPSDSADRIVNAYLNILCENPHLYDKVEFDIVFTVWTPDFNEIAQKRLLPYGVTKKDIIQLEAGLREITLNALSRLKNDTRSVMHLKPRSEDICESSLSNIDKIFALINDCEEYGTLAFSHAARAGFVASVLLKSFVSQKIITEEKRLNFLSSFNTVAGDFEKDKYEYSKGNLKEDYLIKKYGHLRPGTYDVTAQAYWEDPKKYLLPNESKKNIKKNIKIKFTLDEKKGIEGFLCQLGSRIDFDEFIGYLITATQERERVKFEFSRNLSLALDHCVKFGRDLNIERSEVAFLNYNDFVDIKLGVIQTSEIKNLIKSRQERYSLTKVIELPAIIKSETDFFAHERYSSQPNFIGINILAGDICFIDSKNKKNLKNKIAIIPQADPGYDWLFGQEISGLITKYGGANSHMAIRSAEIGLPAVIGIGEKMFEELSNAESVEIDCLNQILRIIK